MATFDFIKFSKENAARSEAWHGNKKWTTTEWLLAMIGEAGEACNAQKKYNRARDGLDRTGNKTSVADYKDQILYELADTVIYADLAAHSLGGNLSRYVVAKFNAVSERVKFSQRVFIEDSKPIEVMTHSVADVIAHLISVEINFSVQAKDNAISIYSRADADRCKMLYPRLFRIALDGNSRMAQADFSR